MFEQIRPNWISADYRETAALSAPISNWISHVSAEEHGKGAVDHRGKVMFFRDGSAQNTLEGACHRGYFRNRRADEQNFGKMGF